MDFTAGKVVVVTGATSGIGKAACHLLTQRGLTVIAAGRNKKEGEQLNALFIPTDIQNESSVRALIEKAAGPYGGIDFALNCAGIEGPMRPLVDEDQTSWNEVINTNLKGVWLAMKYQIPAMIARGGGAIVNVSSVLASIAVANSALYSASKAGVEALSRVAAIEYGPQRIRVNTVSPGATATPMLARILPPEAYATLAAQNPLGTIATPEQVAHTLLWLLSPLASHINGATIPVDGGQSLKA